MHNTKFILIALLLTGCNLIASESGPTATSNDEKNPVGQKTDLPATFSKSTEPVSTASKTIDPEANPKLTPDINTNPLSTLSAPDTPTNKLSKTPEAPLATSKNVTPDTASSTSSSSTSTTSTSTTTAPKPDPTTLKPDSTTPNSDPTTPTPDPKTPKPEPPTPKPDTTTPTPETTTSRPDTTSSTQGTTTPQPDTTTSKPDTTTSKPVTTTTPKPKPYPQPSIGQWNSSCIMVKMAAQLNVTYVTKDNKNATALYNIPPNATVNDSQCQAVTQVIQISWGTAEAEHSMLLQFDLKDKTSELTMLRFIIAIIGDEFPNALENQTISLLHRGKEFAAPVEMSYHCTRSQRFNLTEVVTATEMSGSVTMHDVQVEAFRKTNSSSNFSAVHDCDSADTPDIVPIAVGIALVAMIMIILTSYLCARRRSNLRGYMSF